VVAFTLGAGSPGDIGSEEEGGGGLLLLEKYVDHPFRPMSKARAGATLGP
jgi:hypothetical protein